eukprot:scaffold3743_cov120-Isochrysis_galbana.AAC.6
MAVGRSMAVIASLLLSAAGTPLASRRAFMRSLAVAAVPTALTPLAASAIINGQAVSDAEAAASGSVGLYIDLSNCNVSYGIARVAPTPRTTHIP